MGFQKTNNIFENYIRDYTLILKINKIRLNIFSLFILLTTIKVTITAENIKFVLEIDFIKNKAFR